MTDKEKIKEEIERQKSFYQRTFDVLHPDDLDATIAYAHIELSDMLLQFIDSLPEEHNEYLAKEINEYFWKEIANNKDIVLHYSYFYDIARHFAEWQKQQMMKDAVEGEVRKGYVGNQIIVHSKDGSAKYVAFDASYADAFCVGDKVKIIILKTEQQ